MRGLRAILVIVLAAVAVSAVAVTGFAQSGPPLAPGASAPPATAPTREELETQVAIMRDYIDKLERQIKEQAAPDDELIKAYREAVVTQYASIRKQAEIVNTAFDDHRFILKMSLLLVATVIVAGLFFSYLQLRESLRVAGTAVSSDFEISASKLRLTTSVLGVIVLAISLAFFYIFATTLLKVEIAGGGSSPLPAPAPQVSAK